MSLPTSLPNNTNLPNNNMYGVVDGLYECNLARTEELNDRIAGRNVPSSILQPQFSMRPVSTKYALMPILDRRPVAKEPIMRVPNYSIATTFNPGNATAPWAGFATTVNDESRLRNQFFALQSCEQPNYVPSSNSELYNSIVVGREERQPFPKLFEQQTFADFNPNVCNLGKNLFDNCTRVQLKNLSS